MSAKVEQWARLTATERLAYRDEMRALGLQCRPLAGIVDEACVRLWKRYEAFPFVVHISGHELDVDGRECINITVQEATSRLEVPSDYLGFPVYVRTRAAAVAIYVKTARVVFDNIVIAGYTDEAWVDEWRADLLSRAERIPGLLFHKGPFVLLEDAIRSRLFNMEEGDRWRRIRHNVREIIFLKNEKYVRHPDMFAAFDWVGVKASFDNFIKEVRAKK